MKKYLHEIILVIFLFCFVAWQDVYAQQTTIPVQAADAGVALAKQTIDQLAADKENQLDQINQENAKIAYDNANQFPIQQNLLSLATQSVPLQSAVNLCASNPSKYCPGYGS